MRGVSISVRREEVFINGRHSSALAREVVWWKSILMEALMDDGRGHEWLFPDYCHIMTGRVPADTRVGVNHCRNLYLLVRVNLTNYDIFALSSR